MNFPAVFRQSWQNLWYNCFTFINRLGDVKDEYSNDLV